MKYLLVFFTRLTPFAMPLVQIEPSLVNPAIRQIANAMTMSHIVLPLPDVEVSGVPDHNSEPCPLPMVKLSNK